MYLLFDEKENRVGSDASTDTLVTISKNLLIKRYIDGMHNSGYYTIRDPYGMAIMTIYPSISFNIRNF